MATIAGVLPIQDICTQDRSSTADYYGQLVKVFDLVYTILSQERGQKERTSARSQRRAFEYGRLNTSFLVFPLRPGTS